MKLQRIKANKHRSNDDSAIQNNAIITTLIVTRTIAVAAL